MICGKNGHACMHVKKGASLGWILTTTDRGILVTCLKSKNLQ